MSKVLPNKKVSFVLDIPNDLYIQYTGIAQAHKVSVHELLLARLAQSVNHDAQRGLYFNDDERREMEKLLAANVSGPQDIIGRVRRLVAVSVDQVQINLKPQLLERLKARCIKRDWSEWLKTVLTEQLESYVGMR